MKPKKKQAVPNGWLFINEETNCFMLELEAKPDDWIKVANFSWELYANVENFITPSKYVVAGVKFEKVNNGLIYWNLNKYDRCQITFCI